jgi:sterol desaturase/sphingolipid hydroxylase (fatty acid hydroxylase superfamily)
MEKIKLIGWVFRLLVAGGLVVLGLWQVQLAALVDAHPGVISYVLLALILAIPARITALVGAYLTELLFVGWRLSSLRMLWQPRPSVRLDMLSVFVMVFLPSSRHFEWVLSLGVLYAVDVYRRHVDLSITPLLPGWFAQVLGLLLLRSFLRYWLHRLEHAVPALWALHKFHHSADQMTILTSARRTQFVRGVEDALIVVPMGLLIAPVAQTPSAGSTVFPIVLVFLAFQAFMATNQYLIHSNLNAGYGWIGRWLIASPRMHRLHHATAPEYYNKNFSCDFVIWDRIFGSYVECDPATDVRSIPVGLVDNPFNQRPTAVGSLLEYFMTYLVFWREIRKGLAAWRVVSLTQAVSAERPPSRTGSHDLFNSALE